MTGGARPAELVLPVPTTAPERASSALELAPSQRPVARGILRLLEEAAVRTSLSGTSAPPRLHLWEVRARLLRERVFEDPTGLVGRLARRGLLREVPGTAGGRTFEVPYAEELRRALLDADARAGALAGGAGPSRIRPPLAVEEAARIRAMDQAFHGHLREVLRDREEATRAFGATFDAARLAEYLRGLFGEELYLESLLAILQQYALADAPLVSPTGRTTGATGFHLALYGPPGTGKTFSIDDLVRGNPRNGVPAHGLPGRNRYCGGITPAQFLRLGASYAGRTFNFVVPEFNDWFRYRGMVEPLKLVMEQREVKWETTFGTVGPYTFRSFFSVNYNVRTGGAEDPGPTIADPNFAALEDRMLLRFHTMSSGRFRAVEASAERLELGELDFGLADPIRDHLTLVHAIEAGAPEVADRFPRRGVRLDRSIYDRLHEISERALDRGTPVTFSPRLRSRAVRLAAAAALVGSLGSSGTEPLPLRPQEIEIAARFYEGEISARAARRTDRPRRGRPGRCAAEPAGALAGEEG